MTIEGDLLKKGIRRLKQIESSKKWYWRNPEKHRQEVRERYRNNPEKYRATAKTYMHKNPEKHRAYVKIYYQKLKIDVLSHYSYGVPECFCCGEDRIEFLSVDHIDGGGNKHRKEIGRNGARFYLWLRQNNFPPGYRVLCHNCNQSFGLFGYCPHEIERKQLLQIQKRM